jgi:carboxylate-amine ligase
MKHKAPTFTIGVEEEYLLVDKETRDLCADPPRSIMEECEKRMQGQVSPEFMRAQIEIGTRVCHTVDEVRRDLARLRGTIVDVTGQHGLAPIAASTHPWARWLDQKTTDRERYDSLSAEMQAAARRLLICGMHVHVGIEDDELRIDLMNQFSYFLPHLLSLSCSSPFWEGENTGLKSYRLTVFDALPRTGLPERFASFAEYRRHIGVMINAGLIQDATKIWWDMRPSDRYPTLEMRVTDVCTRLDDAITIAALTVCIMRMLYRLRCGNQRWRMYAPMLLMENRWRAMRYGSDEGLIDLAKGEIVPTAALIEELVNLVREDAEDLDCMAEVEHAVEIVEQGTSADRQVAVFDEALKAGASETDALKAVVDMLVEETARTG